MIKMLSAILPAKRAVRRCPPKLLAGYYCNKINALRETGLSAKIRSPPKTGNIIKTMT